MDEERYSYDSLAELVREQEHIVRNKTADLIVARRSLEKARTQFLVLEKYHPGTQPETLSDAEASLHALSEYVRQLEEQIATARSLIRAYRRAYNDNLPWRRAFRWAKRFVSRTRGRFLDRPPVLPPIEDEQP